MASHAFTPLRQGDRRLVEDSDAMSSHASFNQRHNIYSSNGSGQNSTELQSRRNSANSQLSDADQVIYTSAGSDTSRRASLRASLVRIRQSMRATLVDRTSLLESVEEDDNWFDEGELLFADSVEAIERDQLERKKLVSHSHICRFMVSFIVFLNTIVIAAEAMFINYRLPIFDLLETCFTIFYVLEITYRLYEVGLRAYLTELDWAWNVFDMTITFLSVVDTLTNILTGQTSRASVGRLFRLFRILRMFRAMRFLNEVDYVLATAAKATLKLGVVVLLCIFVSAIIATNMLWDSRDASIAAMFSNLGISMWSMFKLMTLDDWVPISERVIAEKPGMAFFFIIFIFSTSIALISLVPAIFIEISLNSKSREEKLQEERMKDTIKRKKTKMLRTLFQLTDFDDNGKVSINEMKKVLTDGMTLRQLQEAGLTEAGELRDVRLGLFDLWEESLEETNCPEKEISEEDFIGGLLRNATDVSQTSLWRAVTATRLMLRDFASGVRKDLREIKAIQKDLLKLQESKETEKLDFFVRNAVAAIRDELIDTLGNERQVISKSDISEGALDQISKSSVMQSATAPQQSPCESMGASSTMASSRSLLGAYGPTMPGLNLNITNRFRNLLSPRRSPRSTSSSPDSVTPKRPKRMAPGPGSLDSREHQSTHHGTEIESQETGILMRGASANMSYDFGQSMSSFSSPSSSGVGRKLTSQEDVVKALVSISKPSKMRVSL